MPASLGDLIVSLGIDPSGLAAGASSIESSLESLGTRLFFLGSRIGAAFSVPLAGAVAAIGEYGAAFDQAMTESLAIMDEVTPQIRAALESQAKAISETTKYSSVEAAKAYYDLASAGLNATESMQALPIVAQFAQAGLMNLSQSADWLAGSQAALGLKTSDAATNMANMTRISDVLVTVNNKSIGTVQDYAKALTNQGAVAIRTYGLSLEEGTAILGVFGQQHILGQRAGTMLMMTLRDLTSAAIRHKDAFAAAGIAVFDASGKMKPMADIADDITRKLAPMSAEGRRAELMTLGLTARSMQGILALVGEGDALRNLTGELMNAGGATESVANKQMQSFNNQMALLWHQIENTAIEIFQSFVPAFKDYVVPLIQKAIDVFKEFAHWLENLSEPMKGFVLGVVGLGVALGPVLLAIGGLAMLGSVGAAIVTIGATLTGLAEAAAPAAAAATAAAEGITAAGAAAEAVAGASLGALIAVWGGVVIVVTASVLWVENAVGGWTRFGELINGLTGGILGDLVEILQTIVGWLVKHAETFTNLWLVIKYGTAQVLQYFKDNLNAVVDSMHNGYSLLGLLRGAFDLIWTAVSNFGEVLKNVNTFLTDHLYWLKAIEDWISNHITNALKSAVDWYNNLVKAAKDYDAVTNGKQGSDIPLPADLFTGPQQPTGTGLPSGTGGADAVARLTAYKKAAEDILGIGPTLQQTIDGLDGSVAEGIKYYLERGAKVSELATFYGVLQTQVEAIKSVMDNEAIDLQNHIRWMGDFADEGEKAAAAIGKSLGPALLIFSQTMGDINLASKPVTDLLNKFISVKDKMGGNQTLIPGLAPDLSDQAAAHMQKVADTTLETANYVTLLGKTFNDMGRISTGAIGQTMRALGAMFNMLGMSMKQDAAGGGQFGSLSTVFNSDASGGDRLAAGATAGGTIAGGAMNIADATSSHRSAWGNAGAGALAGAEAGAAFGPYGMAIGAAAGLIVGLIRGEPAWAKAADEVAKDFGVKISDSLAKTIADQADADFGGSRQAAEIANLTGIIKEAGGITNQNIGQIEGKLHDAFSMFMTGQMTMAQANKVLEDSWNEIAKAGTDAMGFLDDKLIDTIRIDKELGFQTKAITQYLQDQSGAVSEGFNLIATGAMKPLNDLNAQLLQIGNNLTNGLDPGKSAADIQKYIVGITQQIADANAQIDTIQQKIAKGTATPADIQKMADLRDKIIELQKQYATLGDEQAALGDKMTVALQGGQDAFDRLGRLASVSFGAALASGKGFLQALNEIGPGLDQLSAAATNFGFKQTDAFSKLLGIRAFTQANADLVNELSGVNEMMTGLQNSGLMTESTFTDLGAEAASVFARMKVQGLDDNSSLLLMQPTLQTLWEGEQRFGYTADDSTQALIDQAKEMGLVGETHRDVNQQMLDQLTHLNDTMKDFVNLLTGNTIPALNGVGTTGVNAVGGLTRALQNTPWRDWENAGVNAANHVESEIDHVTFGRSPTGVQGLNTMLLTSRSIAEDVAGNMVMSFNSVETSVNSNIDALRAMAVQALATGDTVRAAQLQAQITAQTYGPTLGGLFTSNQPTPGSTGTAGSDTLSPSQIHDLAVTALKNGGFAVTDENLTKMAAYAGYTQGSSQTRQWAIDLLNGMTNDKLKAILSAPSIGGLRTNNDPSGNPNDVRSVDLPMMGTGGILMGPRAIVAGDVPEAVIPLSQLKSYLQPGYTAGAGGGTYTVVLEVDGRVLARKSLEYMPEELRRNGIFT